MKICSSRQGPHHVEKKLSEDVVPMATIEDSLLTYKVIPDLEGYDERLWIYVNDPPIIASKPTPKRSSEISSSNAYAHPVMRLNQIKLLSFVEHF